MIQISLHGSSFVGSQCGYKSTNTWEECVQVLSAYYSPIETFQKRFEELILHVKKLGFERMDIWQPAELNWTWATQEHIEYAKAIIDQHGMAISSLAGEFGVTREEFLSACRLAKGIGAPILSGTTGLYLSDRNFVIDCLKRFELRLAIENEVELTAAEMLAEIGDGGNGIIGTALDTGWYATHRYDVIRAINELKDHILHVHLKDVYPGEEHITCGYGKGCVPIEMSVQALLETGFDGTLSIENHTLDHNPDEELIEGRKIVESFLRTR
jgi:L-ribulose-5-phosphate 3-epimerase